jgi:hypothetical protein
VAQAVRRPSTPIQPIEQSDPTAWVRHGMIPAMTTSSTTLTMATQLVPNEVWAAIQPLLPAKRPHPKGGRPWIQDRAVLGGIIYVLRRRGALAAAAGERARLRQRRDLLAAAARLASRGRLGGLASPAAGLAGRRGPGRLVPGRHRLGQRPGPAWGELVGANPVDRGKPGSKYHLLIDADGIPLAVGLSAANTHDRSRLAPGMVGQWAAGVGRVPWGAGRPPLPVRRDQRAGHSHRSDRLDRQPPRS